MKNLSDTDAYSFYDHCFAGAVRTVSHVVSVRNLTQPFWNRWRASEIEDHHLFEFLGSIISFDDWPAAAMRLVRAETQRPETARPELSDSLRVDRLRRLSYLCNLGQWGILPLGHEKRTAYRCCRDSYIEAETLAFGSRYRRFAFDHGGRRFHANMHLPEDANEHTPPVLVVHGIDGCKEEHLATELALVERGMVAVGFDGPGQAEALLLNGIHWTADFPQVICALLDDLGRRGICDTRNAGLLGISFGGVWCYQAAAQDPRIRALYDLASPINASAFDKVPFLLKTKICQVTGARTDAELRQVFARNRIDDPRLLGRVGAAVRIVQGHRDRVVALADKTWLRDVLLEREGSRTSWLTFEDGDHACTNHLTEIRRDVCTFFSETLGARPA